MVSTSDRPEGDTTLVSGFGCSGVFGGVLVGSWFVFGPWVGSAGCRYYLSNEIGRASLDK